MDYLDDESMLLSPAPRRRVRPGKAKAMTEIIKKATKEGRDGAVIFMIEIEFLQKHGLLVAGSCPSQTHDERQY